MEGIVTVTPQTELLLTTSETSLELGIPKRVLSEMRRSGTGPRFTTLTRATILYFREEVLEWKRAHSATGSL